MGWETVNRMGWKTVNRMGWETVNRMGGKMLIEWGETGGGGCNPKKPYPSLTFSRVGVGFFWILLGFFGFFLGFKKINNFC